MNRPAGSVSHQPGVPEHPQVVRHQGLARAERVLEMAHAQLLGGEQGEDPQPQRVRRDLQHVPDPLTRINAGRY